MVINLEVEERFNSACNVGEAKRQGNGKGGGEGGEMFRTMLHTRQMVASYFTLTSHSAKHA